MPKNGVIGEIGINTRKAADGRHPAFISSVILPDTHPALPEGTLLTAGSSAGLAALAPAELAPATSGSGAGPIVPGDQMLGVLEEAVEADEAVGNVLVHGSCPAELLVTVDPDDGTVSPATADHIAALRGIGIYV
jgi:hypothetical protein